jgi:hypothetical protein
VGVFSWKKEDFDQKKMVLLWKRGYGGLCVRLVPSGDEMLSSFQKQHDYTWGVEGSRCRVNKKDFSAKMDFDS